jgi:hypothetical protein
VRKMWRTIHILSLLGLASVLIYIAVPLYDLYLLVSGQVEPYRFSISFGKFGVLACFVGIMLSLRSKALQVLAT